MGRGETWDEGSLRVTIEGESTSKISKNVALNKLLGRLEATQVRLNKKVDNKTNNNEINPQWILDANINAKKIKIVKDEIKKGNVDVARQGIIGVIKDQTQLEKNHKPHSLTSVTTHGRLLHKKIKD